MSTEILVPFSLTPSGGIAVTTDPNVQAQQHVNALISTTMGGRAMQPEYGVDLTGQVFAPDSPDLAPDVLIDVQQAFALWEPAIQILNVSSLAPSAGDLLTGAVTLDVEWAIPGQTAAATTSGTSQATILPGGTVIIDQQVIS